MKRAISVVVFLLVISIGLSAQDRKKRVAILDFEYGTVRSAVAGLFGTDVDVGRGISDLLVKHLVKDGTYSVIERRMLEKIMAEQNFSNSDRANPTSAAQLGKLLGVDAIIVGSITQFGGENKNVKVGGGGGGLGKLGFGGFGKKDSKATVAIDARLIDVDTGEILGVADGKGESKRGGVSLLGGGGGWGGWGAGGVDFSSSNFQETIIGEAVAAAVSNLSTGVIGANDKLKVRTIKVEALIAFVDKDTVVLNVGAKAGLKAGDKLSVERVKQEIKDPATGKVLRRMADKIGELEVTDADDTSAVAKIVSGTGFKIGDLAKTVVQ